jgi:hypothetical protein
MEEDFWEISAEQMAVLLGFMRGYDILWTGDEAHQAFLTYPVDRLANGPFPDLANLHKQFSSMERPVFDTILSTVRSRYLDLGATGVFVPYLRAENMDRPAACGGYPRLR